MGPEPRQPAQCANPPLGACSARQWVLPRCPPFFEPRGDIQHHAPGISPPPFAAPHPQQGCRAMRQRILGSNTHPCCRRMVITTLISMFCLVAVQRKPDQCRMLPCVRHSRWLSKVLRVFGSTCSHGRQGGGGDGGTPGGHGYRNPCRENASPPSPNQLVPEI